MMRRSKYLALVVLVLCWPALSWGQQEMRSATKGSSTPLPITGTVIDANHNGLDVNIVGGSGGSGGTQYAEDSAHVSGDSVNMAGVVQQSADAALSSDGDRSVLQVDGNGYLKVNIKAGAGSGGTAMTDDAAFTPATTSITPAGFMFDDVSPDSVNEGDGGVGRMSANRNIYTTIRDAAGNERGVNINASNELLTNANTELPAAAALADDTSNPTVPGVGAFSMCWDGTNWDRCAKGTGGNGAVDSNTQRVTLANDSTGVLASIGTIGTSVTPGTSAAHLGKAEDVAHGSGDTGVMLLGVRNDNGSTTFSDTNGDYTPVATDSAGRVLIGLVAGSVTPGTANVHLGKAEDGAHTTGDTGVMMLGVRAASPTERSAGPTDGDYEPLGINAAGAVWMTPTPTTAGGLSIFRSIDLDETEEDIKTSAGQMYGYYFANLSASVRHLKFYNATAANVTVGSTTPIMTFPVAAGASGHVEFSHGIAFSTALSAAVTTGVADSDTGAPGTNDFVLNVFYK